MNAKSLKHSNLILGPGPARTLLMGPSDEQEISYIGLMSWK